MRYDPSSRALSFASVEEVDEFHVELTALLRETMIHTTRRIADSHEARNASREVMREYRLLMRAINALRRELPHKSFG
jgi:hypothetical protein